MALSTRSTPRPVVGATRARQGRLGRPVLWVLVASILLVVLGFLASYAFKGSDLARAPDQGGAPAAAARTFNAPQPGAAARQNYQTGGALAPQNQGAPGQPDKSKTTEP